MYRKEIGFVFCKHLTTNKVWAGLHWAERKRYKDEVRQSVIASPLMDLVKFSQPVDIWFKPMSGKGQRLFDTSNYSVMVKVIEDIMVEEGLFIDDSQKYVRAIKMLPAERSHDSGMAICIESTKDENPFTFSES